ncbi:protein involved in gliding motility RemC [Algoriphagus boseongensis]|uniref:Protein involved in gliding motility RemC n=1 Tax=Algoriphagus boseongensis TaxID=1442587 RepID=A0A4R6T963_9BACT|nr:glycosyltransferase [Algoriphagus boseongensis]TDQ19610.1 protein involved in gliding motility RemC [Algoriphagus boseongensis]
MRILFLGETYRADAQTWIRGIENASGISIETKEIPRTGGRISRMVHAIKFLLSLAFSRTKYDLVLAERATSYGFFSLLVNAKVRAVAQQGISDVWPEHGFAGWYKGILQSSTYKKADLIHAWGYVMTFAMITSGATPSKILVRPKGLDLRKFQFEGMERKKANLAIVTRSLYPIYRHSEILEAISILKRKGIELSCNMVGDGEELANLKSITKALDLENQVNWLGRIQNDDLPNYLNQAQLYIAVPETEGVSASLFEAMACGCFPIVSDLPANRAFIQSGKNGFLVPVGDYTALAHAIEKFLNNTESYHEAIHQNRIFIERNCNLKLNMEDFFTRYSQLLNQKA